MPARPTTSGASRLQSGYIYHYAFVMLIGVVALVSLYLLTRGR
jgi:NADH-quinone oxidoreductase subunit L